MVALLCYATGALSAIERQTVDARFTIRGSRPVDSRIVIVANDARTSAALRVRPPIPRVYYARMLDLLRAANPRLIAIDSAFGGFTDPRDDSALLNALAHDGPILVVTEELPDGGVVWPAQEPNAKGAVMASASVDTDPDGVVRRMLYAPVRLETFPVRAAEMLLGHPIAKANFPSDRAWIDLRGPPGSYTTYSFIDVLDGRVPTSSFAGKAVLVGSTNPLTQDVATTAVSSIPMSGVEVQANALSTILDGFPLTAAGAPLDLLLILALAALPPLLSIRLNALLVFVVSLAAAAIFLVLVQLAFDSGSMVSVPEPMLALVLATAGSIAADAYVQRRQLRNLQEFFDLLPSPVSDFFISYRREQSELAANTLKEGLARRFGEQRVFMDKEAIAPGQEWPRRVEEAIAACRAMVVVIGPQWLKAQAADGSRRLRNPNDWVRKEIEAALARPDIAVVPVLHDGAQPPSREALPDSITPLADREAVHLTGAHMDSWIEELARSMQMGRLRDAQASSDVGRPAGAEPETQAVRRTASFLSRPGDPSESLGDP